MSLHSSFFPAVLLFNMSIPKCLHIYFVNNIVLKFLLSNLSISLQFHICFHFFSLYLHQCIFSTTESRGSRFFCDLLIVCLPLVAYGTLTYVEGSSTASKKLFCPLFLRSTFIDFLNSIRWVKAVVNGPKSSSVCICIIHEVFITSSFTSLLFFYYSSCLLRFQYLRSPSSRLFVLHLT